MPGHVTILGPQIETLLRDARARRLRVVEAVAFRMAGEDSVHVFYERPPYQPVGQPEPAYFVIREDSRLPEDLPATLRSMGADEDSTIVVLDAAGRGPAKAYAGPDAAEECVLHLITPYGDAAPRAGGLLDTSLLSERRVFIAGLGSFGSTAAVELAKAGVGRFALADMDRLEPGNIMRHACPVSDIGRMKTFAVRDAILARNPGAQVDTFECDVDRHMELLREQTRGSDILICLTGEGRSRFNCNAAALAAARPALFARAVTRAAGGDVFRYRPGGPCLACLFNQGLAMGSDEVSGTRDAARATPDYAPPGYDAALVQPGLAADIAPIVQMVVKLALVELAPRGVAHWDRLREDLEAPFYIWANRRDDIYSGLEPMQYYFNRSSILRWYGVRVPRESGCMSCGLG